MKQSKAPERSEATIHSLSHEGAGIATLCGKTTFISGALPGETVACQLIQKRGHYHVAEMIELIKSSPLRNSPPCQHFGLCGGCSLQHMSQEAQLQLKQD